MYRIGLGISGTVPETDEGALDSGAFDDWRRGEAVKWYTQSAQHGHAKAQNELGWLYDVGWSVERDTREAVKWYTFAAEAGQAYAQCRLGEMYANGLGVVQHYREAVKWFTKAAQQGDARAQHCLGLMYSNGAGKDYIKAYAWFHLAAKQGDESAGQERDRVARKMNKAQITKAQQFARECHWRVVSHQLMGQR